MKKLKQIYNKCWSGKVWSNKKRNQFSRKAALAFLKIFYLVPNFITVQIQPIVYLYFKYLSSLNGEKTRLQLKFYFIHNLIPFIFFSLSASSLFFVIYVDGPVYEAY